jgi:predicted O-methyltransferase YrrM
MIILNARVKMQRQGLLDFIMYLNTIKHTKKMTILEVGSFVGNSASIFAPHFGHVICVDSWTDKGLSDTARLMWKEQGYTKEILEAAFDKAVSGFDNVEKIKGDSVEVGNQFDRKVDMVYIDAAHDYESVVNDIAAWRDKATMFMSGHDYWPKRFDGVIKAVNEAFGKPEKVFADNSWLVRI